MKTRAFIPTNGNAFSLIDCLSSALVADTVPVIQLDNKYLNGDTSGMRYLVVTCVDTVAEDITLYDPDTNSSARRYLSYDQLENILIQSGVIWVSAFGVDQAEIGLATVMAEYPEGSYFNNTGTACNCHNDKTINCITGLCDCKKFDGGVQCMGFAKYVYFNIKGKLDSEASKPDRNITLTEYTARQNLKGLSIGTHIRLKLRSSTSENPVKHSIALISTTDDEITFAQANWNNTCEVSYKTYTWLKFASVFDKLYWYAD